MGWIKFDDAYMCDLSEIKAHIQKGGWNIRCPDCQAWIFPPDNTSLIKKEFNIWVPYDGNIVLHEKEKGVTHWFQECRICDAMLTVFNK